MIEKEQLVELLVENPNSKLIAPLIGEVECLSKVDLNYEVELLKGVWELRWSS